jgi:hypothetical protein
MNAPQFDAEKPSQQNLDPVYTHMSRHGRLSSWSRATGVSGREPNFVAGEIGKSAACMRDTYSEPELVGVRAHLRKASAGSWAIRPRTAETSANATRQKRQRNATIGCASRLASRLDCI